MGSGCENEGKARVVDRGWKAHLLSIADSRSSSMFIHREDLLLLRVANLGGRLKQLHFRRSSLNTCHKPGIEVLICLLRTFISSYPKAQILSGRYLNSSSKAGKVGVFRHNGASPSSSHTVVGSWVAGIFTCVWCMPMLPRAS